jgi:acyl-CoA dehydrogenase
MDFAHSADTTAYLDRVAAFMATEIEPVEANYLHAVRDADDPWQPLPLIDELKAKARAQRLWNMFLADHRYGAGLSNVAYAPIAELTGRSVIAPEVFNCSAPDTGNMEVLIEFGSHEQHERWLHPLLAGEIRSAFCMTEPDVASSDATNMEATAIVDGHDIVVNGHKWWSTGIGHPRCKVLVFLGLTDPDAPRHRRHSMVLIPRDAAGVAVERLLPTMGFFDEPHGHGVVRFEDVRVPLGNAIGGPGRGFEIAQSRLGSGRVHHCMRLIGLAERALELACRRATTRVAFGKPLVELGGNAERIADARIAIDSARLLVLRTAWLLDTVGAKGARSEVSQIKVLVPSMVQRVVDMAMQLHGGAGLSNDFPLAAAWANARSLRLADGPDEVHRAVVARQELAKYQTA